MAYGLKYTIPFKDVDNNTNLVSIYQDGFVGSSTELIATDVPAVHKYEREDNEDILSPIMSATLTISFYSTENTDFTNFFSYSDREFYVVHEFDGDVVFKGYLLNDIVGEPFQDPPYPVVLTATDALAQLKEVALTGPSVDTDLGTLVFQQLNSLGLGMDFELCNDLYEGLVMDKTKSIFSQDVGENLLIQAGTFDALGLNAFEFLAEVCKTFGWVLFQSNDKWIIQRPIARNISSTVIYLYDFFTGELTSSTNNPMTLEKVADQTNANTDWVPVQQDQLLQYQRPIKKLTVTQGDLGQSIIANGENFNESSWFLEGPYRPVDWTVTPDPDSPIIQVFPNNIPSQTGYDVEQGVSWDIRLMPNGDDTDQPIISKPVFLDFAGLSLDLEIDIIFKLQQDGLGIAVKHVDSLGTARYLQTAILGSFKLLAWSETYSTFAFYNTASAERQTRKFKLDSFVLPTAGFLSIELKYLGENLGNEGNTVVNSAKIIPIFDGLRNPSQIKKIYETARAYTSLREDTLKFSDLCITASKNWLKIGDLPAIVFVEKSLASTPNIIQVPSGAVTQVNRLTDTLGANTLSFSGGTVTGVYQRQFVAAAGFTIDSVFILVSSLSGNPPPPSAELNVTVTTISSTQRNVTVTFNGYDYTGRANVQMQVFLKDSNGNNYQTSTFLLQVNANGTITYTQTDISFENQALLGGYSPTLRDCYARNVLSVYNALSYRLEGSFRRKGDTFGFADLTAELDYINYYTVRLQVIGWEYDLASRVARIIFGQVPTAYVYPIS
jgi:hypothetical protein